MRNGNGNNGNNGNNVTPRHTFPISEMLSGESFLTLHTIKAKNEKNAAAMRGMHK